MVFSRLRYASRLTTRRFKSDEASKLEYLRSANAEMQKYHETRELLRRGKLPSRNKQTPTSYWPAAAALGAFLVVFAAMPFLGKKIAKDDEFREKYVPKALDFTVPKPENPWTREELHQQMLMVQHELRRRAIAGELDDKKLDEMREKMQSDIPKKWNQVHPGSDDEED